VRGLNPCLDMAINIAAAFLILSSSDDSAPAGGRGLVDGPGSGGDAGGGWSICPGLGG
jgi:hypothetical protein